MIKTEKTNTCDLKNQSGAALVVAVIIVLVMTVIGIYAVTTSTIDTKISGYHRFSTASFYAADAGIDFVLVTNPLAAIDSTTPLDDRTFNDSPDSTTNFTAVVTYLGDKAPSDTKSGVRPGFWEYHYDISSEGTVPNMATSTTQVQGIRLGFKE